MSQTFIISIISTIFTAIVGLFFWILQASLSQNFATITKILENKVNSERCQLKHQELDENKKNVDIEFAQNDKQHSEFYEAIKRHEIWEAKHNGCEK